MLHTLAIANYRSLLDLVMPLGRLQVITGPNGSGKSNLYRALRLLAETARGGLVGALAREGGLPSTLWAGPTSISRRMERGEVPVQGTAGGPPIRLRLGFADDRFGYAVTLGLPAVPIRSFGLDPEIKHEAIWALDPRRADGSMYRPARCLVERRRSLVSVRGDAGWEPVSDQLSGWDSMLSELGDPARTPELVQVREAIRAWRFYDGFRTDADAPARAPQIGTFTPVLSADGSDLAAALATIVDLNEGGVLDKTIEDAFPRSKLIIPEPQSGRFAFELQQPGLLRPLSAAELSDGTLRYLLLTAVLLSPRPAPLLVLNEPETSLHPSLLPALARLIGTAASRTQVWIVSHSAALVEALASIDGCQLIELEKDLGRTRIRGLGPLDGPPWSWPERGS